MKKYLIITTVLCLFSNVGFGQDSLSIADAIDKALIQNHYVLMAENNEEIAKNNAHPGAAGLLPIIQMSGGTDYTIGKTNLEFSETLPFPDQASNSAGTLMANAGIGFSYVLFDGMKNINTLKKLQSISGKSELETQLHVEQIILQVAGTYLEASRLQSVLLLANQNLKVSLDQMETAKMNFEYGESKLPFLNAQINVNADSLHFINTEKQFKNIMRDLNLLLGDEMDASYLLDKRIVLNENLNLETLLSQAISNNVDLKIATSNMEIAGYNEKIAKSSKYPILRGNAGYLMSYSQSDIGISAQIGSYGFSGGVSLAVPIFDGNVGRKYQQNAKIAIENATINQNRSRLSTEHNIYNLFADYTNLIQVLKMQEKNLEIAQQNYDRTKQVYETGLTNNLNLREAQLSLLNTQNLIESARFSAKMLEYQLLQTAGMLLK